MSANSYELITRYSYLFALLAFLSNIVVYCKRPKGDIMKNSKLIFPHLVIFVIFNIGVLIQQPFIIQTYFDCGYSTQVILFLYFFPFLLKRGLKLIVSTNSNLFTSKLLVLLSILSYQIAAYLRTFKSLRFYLISSVIDGFAMYTSENFIDDIEIGYEGFSIETNQIIILAKSILKVICMVVSSILGALVVKYTSLSFIFYFAVGCFSAAFPYVIIISNGLKFVMKKSPSKHSPPQLHIFYYLFSIAYICVTSFTPFIIRVKKLNCPYSDLYSLFTFIYYFSHGISEFSHKFVSKSNLISIASFGAVISFALMDEKMNNKNAQIHIMCLGLVLANIAYCSSRSIVFRSTTEKFLIYFGTGCFLFLLSFLDYGILLNIIAIIIIVSNCCFLFSFVQ